MEVQIVDILSDDLPSVERDGKDFTITIYGKDRNNQSVICNVTGFKPFFYMKIPESWTNSTVKQMFSDPLVEGNIESFINTTYSYDPKDDLYSIKAAERFKELYGYRCNPDKTPLTYKFVRIEFYSYVAMNRYSEAIRKKYHLLRLQTNTQYHKIFKEWMRLDKDDMCDSHLYESNIHPMLKFIHIQNIQAANWIQLDMTDNLAIQDKKLYPHISSVINDLHYTKVTSLSDDTMSPLIIASYDIECDSSHGDFPLAVKDFKKLALDIYDSLYQMKSLNDYDDDFYDKYLETFVRAGFEDEKRELLRQIYNYIDVSKVYVSDNKKPSDKSITECVEYFKTNSFKTQFNNPKQRDKVINDMTRTLNKLRDDKGNLLQVEGDKVIQIGTVFHKYGDEKPYKRHILVIGPEDDKPDEEICSDLPGITVERCACEEDLLLAWTQTIKEIDPDYITGYNIFGFDFAYMYDRMKTYCNCGKFCNYKCSFKKFLNMGKINSIKTRDHRSKQCCEKKMKASTYGSVDYKRYIHMDGRIIYDLQKEIEKNHNLESYKLDNVAAHFMRGKIKKIESYNKPGKGRLTKLFTNEFGTLKDGDYISLRLHSNIGETYYKDNHKFKIDKCVYNGKDSYLKLLNHYFKFNQETIDGNHISTWEPTTSEYFKIEWCLMKDDISPQDIFEKHKTGGPEGRAEVAKYCIQDCELCINLTLALDIIPNNIAMANVCCVPQSYVYLRGQGAKIFSLISKECDSKGVRIPVLNKPFTGHEYVSYYKSLEGTLEDRKALVKQKLIKDCYLEFYGDLSVIKYTEDIKKIKEYEALKESNPKAKEPWLPYKEYSINTQLEIITDPNPPPRLGYEGAIVLDPEPGIYLEDPVGVVDYASLYPSSIIEKNISHDTIISDTKYLQYLKEGEDYETIQYDNYIYKEEEGKVTITKDICKEQPKITCHFLRRKEGDPMGIIPGVVDSLLKQRKATKKRLKEESNEFKKGVLECQQLSYKLVANSVYGQTGAKTSPIYEPKIAASTTAIGRERIYDAKAGVEGYEELDENGNVKLDDNGKRITKDGWWDSTLANGGVDLGVVEAPTVIYGDTDSVFIKWSRKRLIDGEIKTLVGIPALQYAIDCGIAAGKWVTEHRLNKTFIKDDAQGIKKPQDLEYEKTFYPFILVSKKRYVADKYEFSVDSCKRNSMGIVLKRRDNAPIVKHVFGNVIEKIMIDKDLNKSVEWLKQTLTDIRNGKFNMNYFVITKSLRGYYKNPGGIAHKVLADRIGQRDPGNKPKAGDRMPFAYRKIDETPELVGHYKNGKAKYKKKKILQGDRVEDPEYIRKNNLELDYEFYITNQIMNPVKQVLDLELDSAITEKIFLK